MTNAFKKARDALGTQAMGKGNEATKALDFLGINGDSYDSDLDAFYAIAEALKEVQDTSVQAALANDLFGAKMGSELLPFINAGGNAIADYVKQLDNIGIFSNETVKQLSEFDNEMNEIKMSFKQAGLELGVALLPVIKDFALILKDTIIPFIKELVEKFNGLSTSAKETIVKVLLFTAALSPMLSIGGRVVKMIGEMIPKIAAMSKEIKLASIGWMALGGAAFLAFDIISNWSKMNIVERILKTLATGALVAAAAITIFHASWSMGIAIGAIAAGAVAGIALISSFAKDLEVAMPHVSGNASGGYDIDTPDYSDVYSHAEKSYSDLSSNYTDNSTVNVTVINEAGDSEKELLDKLNRALMLQKQSRM